MDGQTSTDVFKQGNIGKNKKHNGVIGLWKFIYCLMIIALHVGVAMKTDAKIAFRAGSIGVEFFFMVSGYLLAKKALNTSSKNDEIGIKTRDYILGKVKKMFPYILVSYLISMALYTHIYVYSKSDIINTIWDLLFLRNSGMQYRTMLYVAWYISAMLICMIGLYPLILRYKRNFVYIVSPLICILLGGFISYKYGNISGNGDVYKALLRALFELSLGNIIYIASEKIKETRFTSFGKSLITAIEVIGFISILFVTNLEKAHQKYDFIMILILFISISCAFSEQTYFIKWCNNKFVFYLEKLSLPMYLNQVWIMDLVNNIVNKNNITFPFYQRLLLIVVLDIIFSIIMIFIEKYMIKIKDIFIKHVIIKN